MGKQVRKKRQVSESDEDVQPPPHCTQRAGTGTGGAISQLRKVGNAIETQTLARVPNVKAQNIVVPPDEPENAMAPAKKKRKAKMPGQNTTGTPTPAATGLPVLHITDNGRFRLQDKPIPSGYVGSKPLLQSHRALPEPGLMTPVVQSRAGAHTCGAD
ncbi:hypothetical protein EV702DRAFT_1204394 [Suillus placidus]|uniref:Uncharacterized protein n=1 Tax=Suillus placidus TaxID=48579 RepID=A0A9P6ZJ14_9AGAM|nr:hypothetical protein EV702DRAFT_1204394 [Suillus placidus]